MRSLLVIGSLLLILVVLTGCTTFGRISWRNMLVVLRTPDALNSRITDARVADARLAALWVGHSTVLVQMDDKFVLTDPVFTRFVGGVSPRLVEPGIAVEHLPALDAVLISHRHFDHLSKGSLEQIAGKMRTVLTPVGAAGDVPRGEYEVEELPAWQTWEQEGLRVTAVPVLHTGDRLPGEGNSHARAFTGFVFEYHGMVVFFAGDTAWNEEVFRAIAARFPVIDLALMPIGPIAPEAEMLPHHLNPSQALRATKILRAKQMLPIHYDTFINSLDENGDVTREFARAAAQEPGVRAAPLRIGGQRVFVPAVHAGTLALK